ncbi:hypothetical protein L202_04113 [Cryptococcus amylolentus CBS 6039]|uniref:Restriction endonuclease type IV Mrr domain-containing protein n=1 Tax=Cryptococcus amylolentus CBS 6039 TaxID=1295533 RepID=A0A1E3HQ44_9TREE|nr:hypothetical protein L202_04113 [Cryptococcus amylolentus CBS 6039]ODN78479.1 hypothetical protein L202_04113 [Cryptococcus amylolentus CBS 6039]
MTAISPLIRHTTVQVGTAFEKHALAFLTASMSMSVRRVGGAGDGGVDLKGWWWVPADASSDTVDIRGKARRLRVIAQCKAEKKSVGPRAVRELEGVMSQLDYRREQSSSEATVALFLSQTGFTKNAMINASQSRTPMMLLHLPGGQYVDAPPLSSSPGSDSDIEASIKVESVWWNRALSHGVLGGRLELRREMVTNGRGVVGTNVGLWMDGARVDRLVPETGADDL